MTRNTVITLGRRACLAPFIAGIFLSSVLTMKAQQGSEPGAQLQQGTLAGTWKGQYFYPDGRQSVDFIFVFETEACRGRSEESNTFGDKSAPTLYADLSCDSLAIIPRENIVISKTYDGTGNVSHTVTYSGVLSADLSEIAGEWSIERMRGAFNMRRQ